MPMPAAPFSCSALPAKCIMLGASAAPGLESGLSLPQHLWLRAAQLCLHSSGIEDCFHVPCKLTWSTFRGRGQTSAISPQWRNGRNEATDCPHHQAIGASAEALDSCLPMLSMQGY